MLNLIIWNRTVFDIESVFTLTKLFDLQLFWHLTLCKQNLSLY